MTQLTNLKKGSVKKLKGCVTTKHDLAGLSLVQIESILGFENRTFESGAIVWQLQTDEFNRLVDGNVKFKYGGDTGIPKHRQKEFKRQAFRNQILSSFGMIDFSNHDIINYKIRFSNIFKENYNFYFENELNEMYKDILIYIKIKKPTFVKFTPKKENKTKNLDIRFPKGEGGAMQLELKDELNFEIISIIDEYPNGRFTD